MAQCTLALTKDYRKCIEQCDYVLLAQPEHAKAQFRKAKAMTLLYQDHVKEIEAGDLS